MADTAEVQRAKEKLRALVVPAVETLEELMASEHDGIRLGASKEVLDRGGVPAKTDMNVHVEVGMDEEIEELIRGVRRQVEGKRTAQDYLNDGIEDAELVEESFESLEPGEAAAEFIGMPLDDLAPPVPSEHEAPSHAWWQANPGDDEIPM